MQQLPVGLTASVTVPATSANLGPGFDSLGLALELRDEVSVVTVNPADATVSVTGEGADTVALDESHLILRLIREVLASRGYTAAAFTLETQNSIPHARGLGSSAAAVSAAVVLASALLPEDAKLSATEMFDWAAHQEGHPDNVAPALTGGFTVSWNEADGFRSAQLPVSESLRAVACIPEAAVKTAVARQTLPATIPHAQAAANSARTALLTQALAGNADLLMSATEDFLHQRFRASIMPESARLLGQLRAAGLAAVISGAGPTVLVLSLEGSGRESGAGIAGRVSDVIDDEVLSGWRVTDLAIAAQGAKLKEHKR